MADQNGSPTVFAGMARGKLEASGACAVRDWWEKEA